MEFKDFFSMLKKRISDGADVPYFFRNLIAMITDVVDGFIARKTNQITALGKLLDPIADKLTQAAMLCCLVVRFNYMLIPLGMLVIKEVVTGITALISIKKTEQVEGAVWHGKLTTVVLYLMMAVHLVWFNIPTTVSLIMVGVCIGIMIMSFIMYSVRNIKAIKNKPLYSEVISGRRIVDK